MRRSPSFQCSSASRKFLNRRSGAYCAARAVVSVLFSEPKIPQLDGDIAVHRLDDEFQCSSASRKFLNQGAGLQRMRQTMFQCSSASRKFLNKDACGSYAAGRRSFSALQRAENSSRWSSFSVGFCGRVSVLFSEPKIPQMTGGQGRVQLFAFQCSSASRKFLNPTLAPASIHISDRDDHASSFLSLPGASP